MIDLDLEADMDDLVDALIIDELLQGISLAQKALADGPNRALLGRIGWTNWHTYYATRIDVLHLHRFLVAVPYRQTGRFPPDLRSFDLAPGIRAAHDANVFRSGRELFDPNPRQAALLKMWGITAARVLD